MKASILILLLTLGASFTATAQVLLERQVVSVYGQSSSSGNIQLSATSGEIATATLISGTLTITQGFQQPDRNFGADGIEEFYEMFVAYEIFPNPTSDQLTIRLDSEEYVEVSWFLTDAGGRQVSGNRESVAGFGQLESTISLANLPVGMYYLSFVSSNGQLLMSERIQKR